MPWAPTETIAILDELDELVHNAASVPMTDQARFDPRTIDPLLDRLRTAVDGQPGLTALVEDLDALVREAKSVPLTKEIRVEREGIYDLLDGLRAVCGSAAGDSAPTTPVPSEAAAVLDEFDDFVLNAGTVPFTAQVRLDRTRAYALVDRLRAALHDPSAETGAALDELDRRVHGAKSIPLTNDVRVGAVEIFELLERIRGNPSSTADEYMA